MCYCRRLPWSNDISRLWLDDTSDTSDKEVLILRERKTFWQLDKETGTCVCQVTMKTRQPRNQNQTIGLRGLIKIIQICRLFIYSRDSSECSCGCKKDLPPSSLTTQMKVAEWLFSHKWESIPECFIPPTRGWCHSDDLHLLYSRLWKRSQSSPKNRQF